MTLHPQSRALLDELRPVDAAPDETFDPPRHEAIVRMRREAREAALDVPARTGLDHVADVDADGVPCRLYRPRLGAPVALYVHGGGWMFHDLETHDVFCRYLAHTTGWALLAVDYRLAPEHPYPAGLDDVETAARWLRAHGREHRVDPGWLAGIGDSSGANLVAGLGVRDPALLDHRVLLYPPTDRRAARSVEHDNAALDAAEMDWLWESYAPGEAGDLPEVSVLRAPDLARQPPTVLVTAEHDVLRDEGEAYAAALADAGVEVTGLRTLGTVHSFWRQPERFDASRALVVAVGAWLGAARSSRS